MTYKAIRALVILPCAALIFSASSLRAAATVSENFEIPFEFRVQNMTLPAGEYRVQQADGSNVVLLVNIRTGARAQFLRPATTHREGKARLVFEGDDTGHLLRRIQ